MIAMAISCKPRLLIADEPTTALDVTVQAQIFELIKALVEEIGCGVVFITHDLAVARHVCDRIAVMEDGKIIESGKARDIIDHPEHPLTRQLIDAVDH